MGLGRSGWAWGWPEHLQLRSGSPIGSSDRVGTQTGIEWEVDFAKTVDWLNNPKGELVFSPQKTGAAPVTPASAAMSYDAARARADQQAAGYRASAGMTDPNVQAGHTVAARHVPEAPLSAADYDKQQFMELQSRRVPGQEANVTDQTGKTTTNTRHRAQEKVIDQKVADARRANGGKLTPEALMEAGEMVTKSTENTPFDNRNVEAVRNSPKAKPDPTAALVKPFDAKNATPEMLAKIEAENTLSQAKVPSTKVPPPADAPIVETPTTTTTPKNAVVSGSGEGVFSSLAGKLGSALNGTLMGLGVLATLLQYPEFAKFMDDVKTKGWGSFGGDLYGSWDTMSEALHSLPPGTEVLILSPTGSSTVKTGPPGAPIYGVDFL